MIQKFQETERIFVSNSGSEIDIQKELEAKFDELFGSFN